MFWAPHEEESARLGLQHRVWRPVVLDCWQRAGITVGKRVSDVERGPGYATVDLAQIVGPHGEVIALERSQTFIRAMESSCRARSLRECADARAGFDEGYVAEGDLRFRVMSLGGFIC